MDEVTPPRRALSTASSSSATQNIDCPDGGYGWVCVGCVFAINGFTWGVVAAYGVFLSYYLSQDYYPEAKAQDYAFVGGLNFGVAMVAAPLVTVLTRPRFMGTKPPMYAGAVFLLAGFVCASFGTRIWHLYLSQGALVGLGVGFVYVPSIPIISQWFDQNRSLANGVSTAGSGIGGLLFSLATGAMIERLGLPWTLRIIGCVSCCVNVLATFCIMDRNTTIQPKQRPFDPKLLRQQSVLWLLGWAFVSMLGYITLLYSLSDFSLSINLDRAQATNITAFLNLGTAFGRPFIGVISDRLGRLEVASSLTFLCGLVCFALWIPAKTYPNIIVFAIISGAILGVFWVTIGPLCVEIAGLKQLPSLLALSWLSIVLPTTFSEVIALHLKRPGYEREYLYTQLFCGVCYVLAGGCLLQARRTLKSIRSTVTGPE
ncbi:putative transporter MCH2 [Cyphellophora attinorum]|uniref:Putative transporter MCH2 n=1 Tax=Cyphellophora attinorum TaxID=1664694 RepID=A0A0N1HB73_9EURO|nr:putative transporter MCH2 [Phialophora attinorum]KPI40333.1 putative transporter MCH2 [Phialophora attinorum]